MRLPRINLPLLSLVPLLLGGCGPSESATGYEVRGSTVYWVDRVTPDALKGGFGGLVYERRERAIPEADGRTFQASKAPILRRSPSTRAIPNWRPTGTGASSTEAAWGSDPNSRICDDDGVAPRDPRVVRRGAAVWGL